MTTTYFIPPDHISGDNVILPVDEARHAIQVLRHEVDDEIVAVDGAGGWYRVRLTAVSKKQALGVIVERRRDVGETPVNLTMVVGVLKNQKRFETFVEKAGELGVKRIVPLQSRRSEKKNMRLPRLGKILVAAMKQCGRSKLVDVDGVTRFKDWLKQVEETADSSVKYICHEQADDEDNLLQMLQKEPADDMVNREIIIAVGPEGGFADEEIEMAVAAGFKVASLGSLRLRAETAAIVASAMVMMTSD